MLTGQEKVEIRSKDQKLNDKCKSESFEEWKDAN